MGWQIGVMPLRVTDDSGYASFSRVAEAVTFAADRGVKVVNNSFTTYNSFTVAEAARYLRSKGGLFVASMGNSGYRHIDPIFDPNFPESIGVSATDPNDLLASWSDYGIPVDFSAPGWNYTTTSSGGYAAFSGTSVSAPEVSGALMLLFSVNSNFTPDEAEGFLKTTARDLGAPGWDESYGFGRIDIGAAVAAASGGTPPPPPPPPPPAGVAITSYQVSQKTATTAVISWVTNVPSTGTVRYGTASSNLNLSAADSALSATHGVMLTGLAKFTKYYYQITAHSSDGTSTAQSPISSFKTMRK